MRKKPQLMRMIVWDPVVDPNMETNVCSWITDRKEWDAYPVFTFRHGQLHDPKCVIDCQTGEIFFASEQGFKAKMERVPLDDDEWIEVLKSCLATAPAKTFGRVRLMVKAGDWGDDYDNIVYLVAKRVPAPPVAVKSGSKPAAQPALASA